MDVFWKQDRCTFTAMPGSSPGSVCVPPAETVEVSAPGGVHELHIRAPLSGLQISTFDRHPHERPHLDPCCLGANVSPRLEITTSLAHISMSLLTFPRCPIVPMHACVKKSCECGRCAKLAYLTI